MYLLNQLSAFSYALLKWLLGLWVKTTVLPDSVEELGINLNKPICYVLETPSLSNLMLLEMQCHALGLPRPRAVLGSGELSRWRSVYALIPRRGRISSRRNLRSDSGKLKELIDLVQAGEEALDVQLVPVFVLWGRSADKQDTWYRALFSDSWSITGRFRKFFTIAFMGRNSWVQFNAPISIQQELATNAWVDLDQRLNKKMIDHLEQLRRAAIGPDLSHRRILVDDLLKAAEVKRAIVTAVNDEGLSKEQAVDTAREYAEEIAANYNASVIKVLEIVLSWVWNKLYDGVEVNNFEKLQAVAPGNGIIYVPCHRSHIDYLLISYVLFRQGIAPPHGAAGINLNIPLVGSFLRACGAFFIRRSFNDNQLYSAVFREYLHANFVRGVSIEYYIEGGRSRTGRMLSPRLGMLQMTVRSYLRNSDMPLVFVPIYIGYEKLIESKTYVRELSGKQKKKESIFGLLRAVMNLRGSFGKVYMNFGEPLPLSDLLTELRPGWRTERYDSHYRPEWLPAVVDSLGQRIVQRINDAAAVNPVNLVGLALLSTPKRAMGEFELVRQVDLYLNLLKKLPYSDLVTLPDMQGEEIVAYVETSGLLTRYQHSMGDVLHMQDSDSILMTYYRNNVLHLIVVPSLVANCFTNKRELSDDSVKHLVRTMYPFLRNELTLHGTDASLDEEIDKAITSLLDMGLLIRDGKACELRRPTSTTLAAMQLRVLAESVRSMLERYYMGVSLLRKQGSASLTVSDMEAGMVALSQRMSMLFDLNSPEYSDQALFKLFSQSLLEQGLVSLDSDNHLVFSDALAEFSESTKVVLNQQLRHSIHQIIGESSEQH